MEFLATSIKGFVGSLSTLTLDNPANFQKLGGGGGGELEFPPATDMLKWKFFQSALFLYSVIYTSLLFFSYVYMKEYLLFLSHTLNFFSD